MDVVTEDVLFEVHKPGVHPDGGPTWDVVAIDFGALVGHCALEHHASVWMDPQGFVDYGITSSQEVSTEICRRNVSFLSKLEAEVQWLKADKRWDSY